jgi:hypothetical protein
MHITIDYSNGTITVSKNGKDVATYNTTDVSVLVHDGLKARSVNSEVAIQQ